MDDSLLDDSVFDDGGAGSGSDFEGAAVSSIVALGKVLSNGIAEAKSQGQGEARSKARREEGRGT